MAEGFWKLWGAVKETSGKIIEVYKEDLQEFTQSITKDTKEVIIQSSEVINNKIQTINKELEEQNENEENSENGPNAISFLSTKIASGISSLLEQIPSHTPSPSSPATLRNAVEDEEKIVTKDPDNPNFLEWCQSFDISSQTDHISNIIASDESLRSLYSSLVPMTVSYSDFWKRYFFHQKEQQEIEARRAALIQKATAILEDEEEIKWDDFDDVDNSNNNNDEREIDINDNNDKNENINNENINDGDNDNNEGESENKIEKKNSSQNKSFVENSESGNEEVKKFLLASQLLETDETAQDLSKLSIIDDYQNNEDGIVNEIIDSIEDWDSIPTDDIANITEEDWDTWE